MLLLRAITITWQVRRLRLSTIDSRVRDVFAVSRLRVSSMISSRRRLPLSSRKREWDATMCLISFPFATMQAPSMERHSMILPRRFRTLTCGWMRLWQTCSRKLTRVWASRTRFSSSLPRALRMLRLPTCRSIAFRRARCI